MQERLVGPKEISETYGLPLSWIYAKAEAGDMPSFKLGRYVRFRPSEIEAWLEEKRRRSAHREGRPGCPGGSNE